MTKRQSDRVGYPAVEDSVTGSPGHFVTVSLPAVEYGRALEFQRELWRLRSADELPDTLVLLEHPPVITLGKHADRRHLLVSREELERRGVTVYQVERGGDITFHGPGQLVGYPVFRIGNREWGIGNRAQTESGIRPYGLVGVRKFVETLEESLILALAELGVKACARPGYVGVWTRRDSGLCHRMARSSDSLGTRDSGPESRTPDPGPRALRKIASIGVAVRRAVTMHGFALNVTTDLAWFGLMNPCGLERVEMTSVEREAGRADMDAARQAVVRGFERAFGLSLQRNLPRSLTSLTNGLADSASASASVRE